MKGIIRCRISPHMTSQVQTGSGNHLASYPMGTRGSFPSAENKNVWSYTSTPYGFMAWCSVKKKHRDNFTFTLNWKVTNPCMHTGVNTIIIWRFTGWFTKSC